MKYKQHKKILKIGFVTLTASIIAKKINSNPDIVINSMLDIWNSVIPNIKTTTNLLSNIPTDYKYNLLNNLKENKDIYHYKGFSSKVIENIRSAKIKVFKEFRI